MNKEDLMHVMSPYTKIMAQIHAIKIMIDDIDNDVISLMSEKIGLNKDDAKSFIKEVQESLEKQK